jgi:hypothetical protein
MLKALMAVPVWAFRKITASQNDAERCLKLDGPEFEAYVALVLEDNGFKYVALTKGSGDQGVDITAERNGRTYAIQCKNYEGSVGNFAVQEAYTGAQFYGTREKLAHFRMRMRDAGLAVNEDWLIPVPGYDSPSGREGIEQLMKLKHLRKDSRKT